ncbi:hypothetical protein TNCV_3840351 [Trichonephila clavipes]|nr:hypothetical protein TNCV_3840351 [Trichonephila clavipes]
MVPVQGQLSAGWDAKGFNPEHGDVAIYRPFGNFPELNRTVACMVVKVNDRRSSSSCQDEYHCGLDLTASDRWH